MSKVTNVFDKKWEVLTQELEGLGKAGFFPIQYRDSNKPDLTYQEAYKSLQTMAGNEFTIAVCGRVKAGKSTFLNSLFFKDNILPTFTTPLTAKPTYIKYNHADRPDFFRVHFYNKQEFKELTEGFSDEREQKKFNERLTWCHNKFKYNTNDFIGKSYEEETDFSKLEDYVADPISGENKERKIGGKSPYVKKVEIFIKNPALEKVQVVDTPGLEDPDPVNSKETRKLFNSGEVHALIYLFDAEGPSQSDIESIKSDVSCALNNRIFVINKIDTSKPQPANLEKVRSTMYRWGLELESCKQIQLFCKQEQIYGYSSLLVILREKQKNCPDKLTEDEARRVRINETLNPDPSQIAQKIAETLFQSSGQKRLEAGKNKIIQFYNTKDTYLRGKRDDAKDKIDILNKNDFEEEIRKKNEGLDTLGNKKQEIRAKINRALDISWREENETLHKKIDALKKDTIEKALFADDIVDKRDWNKLHRALNSVQYEVAKFNSWLNSELKTYWENTKKGISDQHFNELQILKRNCKIKAREFKNYLNEVEYVPVEVRLDLSDSIEETKKTFKHVLLNAVDKVKKPVNWLTNSLDFNNPAKSATSAQGKATKSFEELFGCLDANAKTLQASIVKALEDHVEEYGRQLQQELDTAKKALTQKQEERNDEIKKCETICQQTQQELNKWNQARAAFEVRLATRV